MATRHGDISSDFESVRTENHNGASSAAGAVGKGGVKINITSDTGDIEISKAEGSNGLAARAASGAGASGQAGEDRARRGRKWPTSK